MGDIASRRNSARRGSHSRARRRSREVAPRALGRAALDFGFGSFHPSPMTRIIPPGKLPNDLLHSILMSMRPEDLSLIVGPGVGEDAAVVDVESIPLIVVTTDPITFTTEAIGYYAVTVSANDIAAIGATPRWFFPTLLLPPGTSEAGARTIFSDIASAASNIGVSLSGGHTEISTAVTRPVVCGAMIGTVSRETLKLKSSIRPGDTIVMTKTAGNEGTAILARDLKGRLMDGGVTSGEISAAAEFIDRLSVLPEARIAASMRSVRAMHDVTEGGVATALWEISAASGYGIEVELDAIPVDPVTATVCRACGIDPLGLIGSGSLLTVIDANSVNQYIRAVSDTGIPAVAVGSVTGPGDQVVATRDGTPVEFPLFAADEIARVAG